MILDKAKMAHEYFMKHGRNNSWMESDVIDAWKYADAMQAEADKRNNKETRDKSIGLDSSVLKPSNSMELEWQPDWSRAPMGFNRFVVGSDGGYGFFTNMEPQLQDDFWFVGADGIVIKDHGYQGNWQDSLRKRPQ